MNSNGRGSGWSPRGRGGHFRPYGKRRHSPHGKKSQNHNPNLKGVDNGNPKAEQPKIENVYMPCVRPISIDKSVDPMKTLIICYDTENAFGNEVGEIFQIGCISSLEDKFSVTMLPQGNIHWGVIKYSGVNVEVKFTSERRKYLYHSKTKEEIPSVPPLDGFKAFVEWLKNQKKKHDANKVILVAHGEKDGPTLMNNLHFYNLVDDFMECVDGFGDSLPLIQNKVAAAFERLHPGETFDAHDALADGEALFKILLKKQNSSSTRILLNTQILKNTARVDDTLELSRFRVSKLFQNQNTFPKDILPIDGLKSYGDLNLVKFMHKEDPDKKNNETEKEPSDALNLDANVRFLAFDVQFLHSQSMHSEIVQISACDVNDCDQNFSVSCYAFDEADLKLPGFISIEDGIKLFLDWVKDWKWILVQFYPHKRVWPGLINHLCFYNLLPNFMSNLVGICDLKYGIPKEHSKQENFEKLYRGLFHESIELHRSKEVVNAIKRIFLEKCRSDDLKLNIQDPKTTLVETKKKLDKSLGDSISQGVHFPIGHIGNYRISEFYLDPWMT